LEDVFVPISGHHCQVNFRKQMPSGVCGTRRFLWKFSDSYRDWIWTCWQM